MVPERTTCIQGEEINPFVSSLDRRSSRPMQPINKVTMSWLILPTIVIEIVRRRFPSFIYRTRPRYSPTRLGVLTEKESPDNIALNAFRKLISCTALTEIFHLNASIDQLAIIKSITAARFQINGLLSAERIDCQAFSRLGCSCICR